ncbi:unnamed protein product [Polarella glacialis]|uniref:Class I SAM-dependent methyltransferase n=1 Tax=Polarella glacialis TaxID=89957 RepID=A0A813KS39_POLGL|nr:unnamed protein product [Polarella glacialis]
MDPAFHGITEAKLMFEVVRWAHRLNFVLDPEVLLRPISLRAQDTEVPTSFFLSYPITFVQNDYQSMPELQCNSGLLHSSRTLQAHVVRKLSQFRHRIHRLSTSFDQRVAKVSNASLPTFQEALLMVAESAQRAYNHEALLVHSCDEARQVLAMTRDSFPRYFAVAASRLQMAFLHHVALPRLVADALLMPPVRFHQHLGGDVCSILSQLLYRLGEHGWSSSWQKQLFAVEIGVAHGCNSACLLESVPDLMLTSIDPFSTPPFEEGAFVNISRRLARYGTRSKLVKDFSTQAVEGHTQALDLLFIDGDHSYEGALADLRLWSPHVRPGGLVAGHDYSPAHPGVVRAVAEQVISLNVTLHLGLDTAWWYVQAE